MAQKRTTSSKRSTTSNTKKKSFLGKLNLTSKRNQFISVILIVAVMGGGWFTYRSFAATTTERARWARPSLICGNQFEGEKQGCTPTKDSAKGNSDVLLLSSKSGYSGNAKASTPNNGILPQGKKRYNVCFTAKGVGRVSTTLTYQNGYHKPEVDDGTYNKIDNSNSYKTYCDAYTITVYSGQRFGVEVTAHETYGNPSTFVSILNVTIADHALPISTSGGGK